LLEKHRVLESLTHRQEGPRRDLFESLQQRQNEAEPRKRLRVMHAAELAYVLEALVSDSLPPDVVDELSGALASNDRTVFEDSIQYGEDRVGRYMSRELVAVLETFSVDELLTELRRRGELPPQTDRVFVTDARHVLRGSVPLQALLLRDPTTPVAGAMSDDTSSFSPHDDARDAVKTFERYDLVSAPVVDERGKLVGRLTVDAAMDFLRDESNLQALKNAGLSGDEDLFAAPWSSARNRWPWLAVNLLTAFIASRVMGRLIHVRVNGVAASWTRF
jgi:magnesium transporter